MDMPEERAKRFYLKWPWNVIVYVVLALVLRIFAIPVILLLMAWNKKQQPDGPEEGYCLQRTRRRLGRLAWALLYLIIALCCGAVFFMQIQEDRSAWKAKDWGMLIVSGVVALGGSALGIYEACTDLRDALCPAKSRLARSIRAQLPYPDEAPDVKELFAMVDRDIRENGMWFDRVAIGKEWIFGDDVTALTRVRGVFPRDEIKVHYVNGRRQSARIVELWIVDDRKQIQCTGLRDPNELKMAVDCLRLRCPEAVFSDHGKMSDLVDQSEEDWQAMERDYRRRRDQRLAREAEQAPASALPKTQGTAHLAQEKAAAQFADLKEKLRAEEAPHTLRAQLTISERGGITREHRSPTDRDVELAMQGLAAGTYIAVCLRDGANYIYLQAGTAEDGRVTVNVSRPGPDRLQVYETKCTDRQAEKYLMDWAAGGLPEDLRQWKDITQKLQKQTSKK